ncbi:unnamed protein product [Allacma fusca]|uniref:Uncharacterized protein n=1 Tax=Allacma fusca TaxID=39272 RepID=A0A8J2L5Y9_9HEXA|nr:unnamed protein product [Allacma fusca]
MWVVFTYVYNSLLILFIAVHLLITFGLGVYVGIYLSQNYEIPRIDEPFKLWSYFVKFLEQRKKPGAMSIFQLSRSGSIRGSGDVSYGSTLELKENSEVKSRPSTPAPESEKVK